MGSRAEEMSLDLPKYVTKRRRRDGTLRFYFQVPEWMRPDNWPPYIRLPDAVGEMFRQAELLNQRMVAERSGTPLAAWPEGSIPHLLAEYHKSESYRALRPKVQKLYDFSARHIVEWSAKAGHPHVRTLRRKIIRNFLNTFEATPTKRHETYKFFRILLGFAVEQEELEVNPVLNMRFKIPEPEVLIWTEAEVDAIVAAADAQGFGYVGDCVLIQHEIGQRHGDCLRLEHGKDYADGVFQFRQSKTGEYLRIPATERLRARLAASGRTAGTLVRSQSGKPFQPRNFTRSFDIVRNAANLRHLKLLHLRHTAVVNLARAGCTLPQIASITGHSLHTCAAIIKRYLPRDSAVAAEAIRKLEEYRKSAVSHEADQGDGT
jgi:hypothetical protein